jgi:hypothetical protein
MLTRFLDWLCVTPPVWPTRGSLTNIIATIREASEIVENAHDAAMEAKFYDRD